jgi:fermentation-respiration switch protein FrsA (DUF1100 family)
VLGEVKKFSYIDKTRFSLVGQSFGTNVVIAAQQKVERIVVCGSFHDPYTLLSNHVHEFNEDGISKSYHSSGRVTTIKPQFWSDFKAYDLPKLVATYNCPILFVHGEKDHLVPPDQAGPLIAAAKQAQVEMIKDSDHDLQPNREQAWQAIIDFFEAAK